MKNVLMIGIASGIIMLFLSRAIVKEPNKIEYRYLPRTLDQQMKDAVFDDDLFDQMFDGEDIWYRSYSKSKL
tara:strand:+ start:11407 stop:11622 length:216 start_codon:yes stop_codon:yes gene_type:complete